LKNKKENGEKKKEGEREKPVDLPKLVSRVYSACQKRSFVCQKILSKNCEGRKKKKK